MRPFFRTGLLLLALLLGLTACQPPAQTPHLLQPTQPAAPQEPVQTGPQAEQLQNPIRLWWPQPQTLNPLTASSRAAQAAYRLVYRSLFSVSETDQLLPDLARNITFMPDGQTVVVVLNEARFHDNSPVTAADVAAVINWLLDRDNDSPWRQGLESLVQARAVGQQVVHLQVSHNDPWLAYALVFPILAETDLQVEPMAIRKGNGLYAIDRFDEVEGTVLTWALAPKDRPPLVLKAYPDQARAMQAFEGDDLDLVLLDTLDLHGYTVRSSLRMDRWTGPEALLLALAAGPADVFSDPDKRCVLKALVQAFQQEGALDGWAEPTWLGVTTGSLFDRPPAADSPCPQVYFDESNTLRLLAPQNDPRRLELAQQLARFFQACGLACEPTFLDQADFVEAVGNRQYDLALLSVFLPPWPVPGFPVIQPRPAWCLTCDTLDLPADLVADEDDLPGGQPDRLSPFEGNRIDQAMAVNQAWLQALAQDMDQSAWAFIGLPFMGVVYSDRIRGQVSGNRYHPYQGIEELWKWSGSS